MTRPDTCTNSEALFTGALQCATCWRFKAPGHRCPEFKERGFRLVAKGKKPFGVRCEVKS